MLVLVLESAFGSGLRKPKINPEVLAHKQTPKLCRVRDKVLYRVEAELKPWRVMCRAEKLAT